MSTERKNKMKKDKNNSPQRVIVPIILLVVALISCVFYLREATMRSEERVYQVASDSAEEQIATLQASLDGRFTTLEAYANALVASSTQIFNNETTMRELEAVRDGTFFFNMLLVEPDGTAHAIDKDDFNISDRSYFVQSMTGNRAIERVENSRYSGESRFMLSVPIIDAGNVIGVIAGSFDEENFSNLLISEAYSRQAYSCIFDSQGDMVVGTKHDLANIKENNILRTVDDSDTVRAIADDLLAKNAGQATYTVDGIQRYAVYIPTGVNDWMLFNVIPNNVVKESISKSLKVGYLITIGTALITLGLLFYIIWSERKAQAVLNRERNNLLQKNEENAIVIRQSGNSIIRYQIQAGVIEHHGDIIRVFGLPEKMENCPNAVYELGIFFPETVAALKKMYEDIQNGVPSGECMVHATNVEGAECWYHLDYDLIYDDQEKPSVAIESIYDITEQHNQEKEYERMLNERKALSKNSIAYICLNLTKNTCETVESSIQSIIDNHNQKTADDFFAYAYECCANGKHKQKFKDTFSRNKLIEDYSQKKTSLSLEYKYCLDCNQEKWLRADLTMTQNPLTHDIEAFISVFDIHYEKMLELVINKLTVFDYEILGVITLSTDTTINFGNNTKIPTISSKDTFKYSTALRKTIELEVEESEKNNVMDAMSLTTIKRELEQKLTYSCVVNVKNDNGEIKKKKWLFGYLDETRDTVIAKRSDVTDIFAEEERRQRILKDALAQAEVASAAKTEFLSRMSHEIRTPMNAIIGMATLAEQCADKPEQILDCISKINASGHYLLALINDILDMSRIESGKVVIQKEEFSLESFLKGINTICCGQAEDKGINYECTISSFVEDWYIGDERKLQQILINLLGNSIKFTPAGGNVKLEIIQERAENGIAHMTIIVSDTGIGISEKFLPHLFNAFEQEYTGSTTNFGGTGLGLAICRNYVALMGGQITVDSTKGKGSKFTVTLPLMVSDKKRTRNTLPAQLKLNHLSALVVDDDTTICEHTKRILEDMGLKAQWVSSCENAVEEVRGKWEHKEAYDLILIDWKMPEMNGIEAARQIRSIVGPDTTIIIITAYDWIAIENEAKAAGVNYFITKPLLKSNLMTAFKNIYEKKQTVRSEPMEESFDFSGKRVLIADDQQINVEIAKRLLEKKNCVVDTAENGLITVERYLSKPDDYYDLILMDVRMPEMDGLTATKTIRQSHKPDAKKIPIIALSANAFEEDMEMSREAGMNAHLAKPIEPNKLYLTLKHYFSL